MATQVTLFPFTGLPASAGGEPTNHDSNGARPVRVVIQDPGVDLAKKTVCIKMRLSTMGNTRKVSTSQIEADADKDLLRVSKHLLDSGGVEGNRPLRRRDPPISLQHLPALRNRHSPAAYR